MFDPLFDSYSADLQDLPTSIIAVGRNPFPLKLSRVLLVGIHWHLQSHDRTGSLLVYTDDMFTCTEMPNPAYLTIILDLGHFSPCARLWSLQPDRHSFRPTNDHPPAERGTTPST